MGDKLNEKTGLEIWMNKIQFLDIIISVPFILFGCLLGAIIGNYLDELMYEHLCRTTSTIPVNQWGFYLFIPFLMGVIFAIIYSLIVIKLTLKDKGGEKKKCHSKIGNQTTKQAT